MEVEDVKNSQNELPVQPELSRKQKVIKEVKSISLILVIVLVFRSIFFEPFRIPSGSMIPTLMIGDFILVNKMAYGFKLPFSDVFSDPIYLFGKDSPKRGDVVVFKYPKDKSLNYIKRVIGIPGDKLEIRNKTIFINGEPIVETDISTSAEAKKIIDDMDEKFIGYNLKIFKAKTGEHEHIVQTDGDNFYKVDYDEREIPEGHFFVIGDNRDFSYDSRYWGLVPHEYVKGEAVLVWFSLIFPFGENNFKFRPWRIGTMIN